MTTITTDRLAGAAYGLAYGDAYGYPVEFDTYKQIIAQHGRLGLPFPTQARVSDDTQMSLALWHALDGHPSDTDELAEQIIAAFLAWRDDPDNNRDPGATCMASLARIDAGTPWREATDPTAKGCGAVMRAPWIGLHPAITRDEVSPVAQLQAAITHGHPTAVVAADVLAQLTADLACGRVTPQRAAGASFALTAAVDYSPMLGDLYARAGYNSPVDYIDAGTDEVTRAIYRVVACANTLRERGYEIDPCTLTGNGWTAEEALATALLITTAYGDEPAEALRRAAMTGGDSDTIAAIVGALVGAAHGECWPAAWEARLEPHYAAELAAIITDTER